MRIFKSFIITIFKEIYSSILTPSSCTIVCKLNKTEFTGTCFIVCRLYKTEFTAADWTKQNLHYMRILASDSGKSGFPFIFLCKALQLYHSDSLLVAHSGNIQYTARMLLIKRSLCSSKISIAKLLGIIRCTFK